MLAGEKFMKVTVQLRAMCDLNFGKFGAFDWYWLEYSSVSTENSSRQPPSVLVCFSGLVDRA